MPQSYPNVRDLAVLQEAMQMVLSSLDADTVLHHILLILRNYFGAAASAVYLVEPGTSNLICRADTGVTATGSGPRIPVGKDTMAGWAAFTKSPLYIPDLTKEARHKVETPGIRSALALPLLVRDRLIGVLEIRSDKPDPFPAEAISLLSVFSGQAAIALENAQLHTTDLRRVRQIEIINLIARSAAAAHDRQQFFTMLIDLLSDTFEGTMIAVVLCAEGDLTVPAHTGTRAIEMQRFFAAQQRGTISDAFATRSLAVVNDFKAELSLPSCFPESGSELCVPLVSLGEVLGAIVLGHQSANFFTAEHRVMAQAAADVCATAVKNVQLSEELRRVANLDPLTGVYNQRYLHSVLGQEISRSRRHGKEFGLVMLDVRDFRKINSALGLETGDSLLRRAAQALRATIRNNDVLCRYVGDRFALLLPELNAEGLVVVVGKLQGALRDVKVPYPHGCVPMSATWAAVQYPADAETEVEVIKVLTSRLDEAKGRAAGSGA
ncbi:MAG TPA: GAF domain-containing protein [Terriglobales bacterium]|nr:GAF domain-containing protein [Terriglobales bacterium]